MIKKILISLITGLTLSCLLALYSSASTAASVKNSVLRLHVVANSDSRYDQSVKIAVRNAILDNAKELFNGSDSKEEAIENVYLHLADLQKIAREEIKNYGADYDVKISVCETFFPTKEYKNGYHLPAGYYDALKIELGQGKGKNWWCILYPPLCLSGSVEGDNALSDVLSQDNLEFVTMGNKGDIELKFKIAEWWGQITKLFD